MSDMKTFTVRDLDRSPGDVLETSRKEGRVRIRARSGQTYIITPEAAPQRRMTSLPAFAERRNRLFKTALTAKTAAKLDQAIAGE